MSKLLKSLLVCPAELLMSVFFLFYLSNYRLYEECIESWPPLTIDCAMAIALQVTMVVRVSFSKLMSEKSGVIASLLVGFILVIMFLFHPTVDFGLIFISYFFCMLFCFFTFLGNRKKKAFKTLMLISVTVVTALVTSFIANIILEIQHECLGADDALVSEAYALVVGTIAFVFTRNVVDIHL